MGCCGKHTSSHQGSLTGNDAVVWNSDRVDQGVQVFSGCDEGETHIIVPGAHRGCSARCQGDVRKTLQVATNSSRQ
jgi:hypothetical protein